jgi:hypothetical protein
VPVCKCAQDTSGQARADARDQVNGTTKNIFFFEIFGKASSHLILKKKHASQGKKA